MKISYAKKDDLTEIVAIYNQAIKAGLNTADTETFSVKDRLEWYEAHTPDQYPLLVAKEDNIVVGYLTISAYRYGRKALKHTAEISYYIHFSHHRKGIGTKLIKKALELCPSIQIKTLVAILIGCNQASVGILKKSGFKEWGCMPNIVEFKSGSYNHLYYGLTLRDDSPID